VLVVTFDPDQFNFITAGKDSYFLLRFPNGGLVLYNDSCDHRGGPLHLGHWDNAGKCLVCPWHGSKYSEKVLRKLAKPLIQRSRSVTAVLDAAPATPVRLVKKTILAQPSAQLS
jgi:nitrite reductase/ring-hydroxylating ferredoxin subunit